MTAELFALLDGREIGRVRQDRNGRVSFVYDERWQSAPDALPLSLSMPLAAAEHRHALIDSFLWGLLPDNPIVLAGWARRFGVSARNAFSLIAHVGEECAGAVQFVRPERVEAMSGEAPAHVDWLDEGAVADRLRRLRADYSAGRSPRDTGQFSLAGAQPKTALVFDGGRWGVPSGPLPTTHILKPPAAGLDGHIENEHFCLALARALDLPAAQSRIMRFEDEVALVVERYDRLRRGSRIVRVHQEDLCQALGVPPTKKYESDGGPGARRIVELLRTQSSARDEDVLTFYDALAFSWLIGASDAHAKNYSVLIASEGKVRLAPLYDLASVLPYDDFEQSGMKLAMKVGGEYRLRDIRLRQWKAAAAELRLGVELALARVRDMAEALPERAAGVRETVVADGLSHPTIDVLIQRLTARATWCRSQLEERTATPG